MDPQDLAQRISALHHQPFGHVDLPGLAARVRTEREGLGLTPRNETEYLRGLLAGALPIPEGKEVEALEMALGLELGELLNPEPPPSLRRQLELRHRVEMNKLEALRLPS